LCRYICVILNKGITPSQLSVYRMFYMFAVRSIYIVKTKVT